MRGVIIVAVTRMGSDYRCVGALDLRTAENLRLLKPDGRNWGPDDIPKFQIGERWEVDVVQRRAPMPPHLEDVLVHTGTRAQGPPATPVEIANLVRGRAPVVQGGLDDLFDGNLLHDGPVSARYVGRGRVPDRSVEFWEVGPTLTRQVTRDRRHGQRTYFELWDARDADIWQARPRIRYTGTQEPVNVIPSGSLVRVSLARWWNPDHGAPQRCYLQLSGWYL